MTGQFAQTQDLDALTAAIIHDAHHADQVRRGDPHNGIDAEKDASRSTVPIIRKLGLSQSTIKSYEYDAEHGHGAWGPGPAKSRPPKKKNP